MQKNAFQWSILYGVNGVYRDYGRCFGDKNAVAREKNFSFEKSVGNNQTCLRTLSILRSLRMKLHFQNFQVLQPSQCSDGFFRAFAPFGAISSIKIFEQTDKNFYIILRHRVIQMILMLKQ